MRQLLRRAWYLIRRRQFDADLREELAFHLAMAREDEQNRGCPPTDASSAARRALGNVTLVREEARAVWIWPWLESRWQDAAYATRSFRRQPGFALVAIATLALGIGATTAVFSVFHQTLLRPLPVPEPGRLVNLSAPGPKDGEAQSTEAGGVDDVFSYPMFRDLEREQTVFTALAGHKLFTANLAHEGETLHGDGMLVSGGYFPALGITPAAGRLLGPDDDRGEEGSQVVVLAHAYWRERFHADPYAINQSLMVNGQVFTIVGVTPDAFSGTTFGQHPSVFVPIAMRRRMEPGTAPIANRRNYWVYLFARLKPGVTAGQASTAINVPYHAIINDIEAPLNKDLYPDEFVRFTAKTITVTDGGRGQSDTPAKMKPALMLLLGVTVCVLLIGCANIANLLLARAAAREGEMAIRLSIGASRVRLVAQLLTESGVLAATGGLAGVFVARWTMAVMPLLLPPSDPVSFHIDGTVLLCATLLVVTTGLLFGLFPACYGTRASLSPLLTRQANAISARHATRFRTSLATFQIALSLTLLVAAGLFVKSLMNVSRIDLGVRADRIVTFGISPGLNGYPPARSQQLVAQVEETIDGLPGVVSASNARVRLLSSDNTGNTLSVEGFTVGPDIDANSLMNEIGPGYFGTLGVPMLAGREFTPADAAGSPKVAIVNEAFAQKFHLGHNPVGKRMGDPNGALDVEIVGLAKDSKYSEVKDGIPAQYFRPTRQIGHLRGTNIYVRTAGDPAGVLALIPKAMATLDPSLPVEDLRTLPEQVRENVALDRLVSVLSAAFAILATLLAALGLYGVMAYTVAQRRREMGLRMALGAPAARVRSMVLRQVGRMVLAGSLIGLVAAVWLGRMAQSLLYGLQGSDPEVLLGSVVMLAAIGLLAGWIPAWRASRINPASVLRNE